MTAVRRTRPANRVGWPVLLVAIGVLGFLVRFGLISRSGLLSIGGYDDGVHFAAAVNLVHGRLLYRDVQFLQPPGIALVTSPFAVLAHFVGDSGAFAAARVTFTVIGGLNAALVAVALRRFGMPAAVTGGVLYALSFAAVYTERTVTLEAVGTTAVLLAIVLLQRAPDAARRSAFLFAGLAGGAAIGFKIWYVVAFAVLLLWARGGRLRFLLGGAIAGVVIYVPFFAAAPVAMWRDVVTAQLGRPELVGPTLQVRLATIFGVRGSGIDTPFEGVEPDVVVNVLLVLTALSLVLALLDRRARLYAALLVAHAAVLLAAPSFFQHYGILTAAPLALIGGVAAGRVAAALPRPGGWIPVVVVVLGLAVSLNMSHDLVESTGSRLPVKKLRAAVAQVHGCVLSDDPGVLIVMDRLTRDIASGCAVQADPSGVGYVLPDPGSETVDRRLKPAFQAEIVRYLWSGDAYMWARGTQLGLQPATAARLETGEPIFVRGRYVLRLTPAH